MKFEYLHSLNRRTEGFVKGMDFDPELAEPRELEPMEDLKKSAPPAKKKKKKKK